MINETLTATQALETIFSESGRIFPELLYTRKEAARYLRNTPRTLERWERKGIGPPVTRAHLGAPRAIAASISSQSENEEAAHPVQARGLDFRRPAHHSPGHARLSIMKAEP